MSEKKLKRAIFLDILNINPQEFEVEIVVTKTLQIGTEDIFNIIKNEKLKYKEDLDFSPYNDFLLNAIKKYIKDNSINAVFDDEEIDYTSCGEIESHALDIFLALEKADILEDIEELV